MILSLEGDHAKVQTQITYTSKARKPCEQRGQGHHYATTNHGTRRTDSRKQQGMVLLESLRIEHDPASPSLGFQVSKS